MASSAANILQRQFKELTRNPVPGFAVDLKDDNIFVWDVAIIGSPKTIYEGGYFKATMAFPPDYPFNPPTFRFDRDFYHPNVYLDGRLCISILHPPGDDPISGEKAEERWNPTQSVESVLMSIISLLADPNCSSPANVDAGVAYRKDRELYDSIVKNQVEISKKDIPPGFKMPQSEKDFMIAAPLEIEEDDNFWYESGDASDFDADDDNYDLDDEDEDD
ncbi:ubiquitin-conjugating enzyme/RWD-like protein [Radiomyces spectabilis]|uniref:ubiquitin-conjugating enzyme/RWD-like protein n=1 Tax=Radiomyces spectabilis TaxID=64574 RepID=UPI00221F29A2|nr:ubiquitin-conjugating enzyme/RWD-like protein [Radiomyces spectabilis]KAI8384574.1 ubiquitin-conjugating enzyme/RWD-like protein [Radiomyces spectabilis]